MHNPVTDYYAGNLDWLAERTLWFVRYGSHAYGLNTAESDLDLRGIAVAPAAYYHGFLQAFEQAESKVPDLTIFDIRKFFKLAADANPNALELLFVDEEDILWATAAGRKLRAHRELFLSRKVKATLSGYAFAQLSRIERHQDWLRNPPTHKPTREEFGLPEMTLLSADILGAIDALKKRQEDEEFPEELETIDWDLPGYVMELYSKERAYQNALRRWQQYAHWQKTRNPKRAALEALWGYDTKNGLHLVRLCRMCREILTTGEVKVKRPDREDLLAIRNGAWTFEQITTYAAQQDEELTALMETSPLPHSPNRKKLDQLCQELVEEGLRI